MHKRICVFLTVIFLFCIQIATAAGNFIKIGKIEYGINNVLKVQEFAEAKITLTNSSPDNFKGKISFEKWVFDNSVYNANSKLRRKIKAYTVSKEFEIAGNSKKIITLPVVFSNTGMAEHYFKIFSSDGKLVLAVKVKPKMSYMKNCVGIFSSRDEAENLADLMKNISKEVNVAILDKNNFPKRSSLLKMFEFIVINNYKTSNLTYEQYQALKDYVAKGGNLIITLGENYQKNLSLFTDNFITGNVTKEKRRDILLKIFKENMLLKNIKYVECDIKNAELINQKHIQRIKFYNGTIIITSFDIFDNNITKYQRGRILDFIIENINTNLSTSPNAVIGYGGYTSYFYTATNIKWPNNNVVLILIMIYIFFVSFGNYYILRKINKRHLMWQMILIESVIWTAIIFGIAGFYKIKQPNVNALDFVVLNPNDEGYVVKKYYQIFVPFSTDIEIKSIEGQKIEPLFLEYEMTDPQFNPANNFEYYPWEKIVFSDFPVPHIKNIVDQKVYKVNDIALDVNIESNDLLNVFVEVNNKSNYEMKNLFLVINNTVVYIEKLKPHSTVRKQVSEVYEILADSIRNKIYNNQNMTKDFRLLDRQATILSEMVPRNVSNPFIIGQIDNYKEDRLNLNSKIVKVHSEVVFRKDFEKTVIMKDKKIILPGAVVPFITKNTFNSLTYVSPNTVTTFYGKGEVEFEYDLSGYLDKVEMVFLQLPKQYGRYNVEEYLFNFKTKKWDIVSLEKPLVLSKNELEKYMDNYKIKVKIIGKDDRSVVTIPLISAKGGV